jgi:AcrR family transcriptional regulator
MPKPTFGNLAEEKRERFLAVAHREFALHDYEQASISRIVAELGIAKGSVYQYFEDKRDLYYFLLDRAATRKLDSIREAVQPQREEGDFFEVHAAILLAGARFDFNHPHLSLILYRATQVGGREESVRLSEELKERSVEFLREFVELAIERGELRGDLDPDLVVHLVNAATLALAPYMEVKHGFSHLEHVRDTDRPLPFSQSDLERAVLGLVDVLRQGLQPPSPQR